ALPAALVLVAATSRLRDCACRGGAAARPARRGRVGDAAARLVAPALGGRACAARARGALLVGGSARATRAASAAASRTARPRRPAVLRPQLVDGRDGPRAGPHTLRRRP